MPPTTNPSRCAEFRPSRTATEPGAGARASQLRPLGRRQAGSGRGHPVGHAGRRGGLLRLLVLAGTLWVLMRVISAVQLVVLAFAAALLVTAMLQPTVVRLKRVGLPHGLATAVTAVLGFVIIGLVGWFVVWQVMENLDTLSDRVRDGIDELKRWLLDSPFHVTESQINDIAKNLNDTIGTNTEEITSAGLQGVTVMVEFLTGLLLAMFCTLFLLYDGKRIWEWSLRLVPAAARPGVARAAPRAGPQAVRAPFTGVLRLGVIPTVAPYLLPTVLRLVHERYPDLDLQVHEEQTSSLLEGLAAGRLDLLLLAVPLGVPGVTEIPLFDEDFVLVMEQDHWLGGRADIPRDALRELPLLLLDEGHCLRDQALDICREAGRTQGAPGHHDRRRALHPGPASGRWLLGVTLLPRTAVPVETGRNDALSTGYFADPAPTRRVALAMRTGSARGGEFEEFAAALREAMKPLPVRIVDSPPG
ncbi:hypothetical protein SBADM41S_11854 [Streptomyces badius]